MLVTSKRTGFLAVFSSQTSTGESEVSDVGLMIEAVGPVLYVYCRNSAEIS